MDMEILKKNLHIVSIDLAILAERSGDRYVRRSALKAYQAIDQCLGWIIANQDREMGICDPKKN